MKFKHGFKAKANRIALRIREQMGLDEIDPIDPVEVCRHFDIEVIKLSELEVDCSAFLGKDKSVFSAVTVPRGMRTAIVHNDAHHPNRQRSNIGHELGHCFLRHPFSPPLTAAGERIRDGSIEGEANFFAGVLLLTNEGARYILMNGFLADAQERYGISKSMLDWRLNESGARIIQKRSGY